MPFVNPFAGVLNGDPMDSSAVNTALDSARDYINSGIVAATDLVADAVESSDVYKPESYGYPTDGTIGVMQQAYKAEAGNGACVMPVMYQAPFVVPWCHTWQGAPERTSILPNLLQPFEVSVVPGMSRRVYIERNSLVNLFASWNYIVLGAMDAVDPLVADTRGTPKALYPQGAAVGSRAGSFVLAYRKSSADDWTIVPSSRRNIYPQEVRIVFEGLTSTDQPRRPLSNFATYGDPPEPPMGVAYGAVSYMSVCHFEAASSVPIIGSGDWYDFTLLYDKGAASPSILQVVLSTRNLLVEVFPNST